jgi:hypothetical protein
MNPLTAMAAKGFHWLGDPNVPCDMVYVDNVVSAVLDALAAPADQMRGEDFNISDGDASTWKEFYDFFGKELNLDLSEVPIDPPRFAARKGPVRSVLGWPLDAISGVGQIATSTEFKQLGRRFLETDPVGSAPRWALERFSGLEKTVRKLVKADDSLPVYHRETGGGPMLCQMGSGGALVSIEKARQKLNYTAPVSRSKAMELTLDWVRHARIV